MRRTTLLLTILTLGLLFAGPIAAQTLQGHWAFDEGSGTTAINSVSPGTNNGSLLGTTVPTYVGGKIGPDALNFHGGASGTTTSYVSVGLNDDFDVAGGAGFSRFAWVNPSTDATTTGLFTQRHSSFTSAVIALFHLANDDLNFQVSNDTRTPNPGSGNVLGTGGDLTAGAWHLVGLTRDDTSGALTLWQNGVGTSFGTSTGPITNFVTGPQIGRHSSSSSQYFDGLIDDASIWGGGLTAGEAIALYNLGDDATFGYDASEVAQLLEVGPGESTIIDKDGRVWSFAEDLTTPLGVPTGIGASTFLLLDAANGTGLANIVPEPTSLAAFAVCFLVLGADAVRRRRKKRSVRA